MLTEREQRFVEAYRGNGRQAAREAGYSAASDASLDVEASRLLSRPEIAAAIEERQAAIQAAADVEPPELSDTHQAFVDAYITTGNVAESARRAGLSKSTGYAVIRRADVQTALEVARVERDAREIASTREQQVWLSELMRDDSLPHDIRLKAQAQLAKITGAALSPKARPGTSGTDPVKPTTNVMVVLNGRGPIE